MNVQQMESRLGSLEGAYSQVAERLTSLDWRFESMERKLDLFRNDMDRRFMWLTGVVFGTWITTMFAILYHTK